MHHNRLALRAHLAFAKNDKRYRVLSGAQSFTTFVDKNCAMRINMWYPTSKVLPKKAASLQDKYFSHNIGHNHSYDFYTIGLLGKGYSSIFRSTDLDISDLSPGDPIEFSKTWGMQLREGKAVFIERENVFHSQFPASEFSISLNVIPFAGFLSSKKQYTLTDDNRKIDRVIIGDTLEERARYLQ